MAQAQPNKMAVAASVAIPVEATLAYIGIGANLGDAAANVAHAFDALAALSDTRLVTRSDLYRSTPIDADGDDYINAVACIETRLAPTALLAALLAIERLQGRARSYRNAPRPLDLDILLFGALQLQTAALTIPHPRITQRAFVLIPLLQIAPAIMIPGMGAAQGFVQAVAGQAIVRVAL